MNAILLAGGYGKRLRPLTNTIPKCLVPINGVPLLKIWLKELEKAKINSVLINTHYLNKKVEYFIKKNKFKIKIKLSYEKKLLGTAGTLIKNIDFFNNENGLFLHADNYCKEPILNLIKKHNSRPSKTIITVLTFTTKKASLCGIFKLNKKNIVKKFYEKPQLQLNNIGNIANGAIYVLSRDFLKLARKKFLMAKNFSEDIIPHLSNKIFCYHTKKTFLDIGTLDNYKKVK